MEIGIMTQGRGAIVGMLTLAWSWAGEVRADWKEDMGWSQLAAELGVAMPTGAGVPVLQAEADGGGGSYLAQGGGPGAFAGTGGFSGKTFYAQDGASGASGHAGTVASYFYANGSSVAPGVTTIYGYLADRFVLDRLLAEGGPEVFPGRVQNHSWVGSVGSDALDQEILRRFDFMLARDGTVGVVGLLNNATMEKLAGNHYNGITVGVRSGAHSRGGTNLDGMGRMKPDLVANIDLTSYATAAVSGVATLLMQGALDSGVVNADRPQVIKALMLAGASKRALPQWRRLTDAKPYDEVFGAGEVNVRESWSIQAAGRWGFSNGAEVAGQGWDFAGSTTAGGGRRYFFSVPPGRFANAFAAALTWHRGIDLDAGTASLADLGLHLHAAVNFEPVGVPLAASLSEVDNVEHVFVRNLPPGQYVLEVTADTEGVDYGLAWQVQEGKGPQMAVRLGDGGEVVLDATGLDPWVSYQIESSTTLTGSWNVEETFRTGDTEAAYSKSWTDLAVSGWRKFYRLRWTPVR